MKTSSTLVFLGTTAVTAALTLGSAVQGCRSSTTGVGGSVTAATSGSTTSGSGGSSAEGGIQTVTIQQITNPNAPGHVGGSTPVQVNGVVAMTSKFLVSHSSSSNSCLWGVFVTAPGLTTVAPYTGILAVSFGTPATATADGGKAYCPTIQAGMPAGDAFPDDVQPGDILDLTGETDSYIPASCTTVDAGMGYSMVPSYQLAKVSTVNRTGKGASTPQPYVLTTSDLDTLAAGADANWLAQWGNALVTAQNVVAEDQNGALTDTYGHMLLDVGSYGIQVGDKLYYVGYVKDTDICYAGPTYVENAMKQVPFTSITGFVYLDYCNWGLSPRNKCHDLQPPSLDCASVADAGPDAGEAYVCSE
jgi:hypothetical protein